jgi:hypothetical protein
MLPCRSRPRTVTFRRMNLSLVLHAYGDNGLSAADAVGKPTLKPRGEHALRRWKEEPAHVSERNIMGPWTIRSPLKPHRNEPQRSVIRSLTIRLHWRLEGTILIKISAQEAWKVPIATISFCRSSLNWQRRRTTVMRVRWVRSQPVKSQLAILVTESGVTQHQTRSTRFTLR